MVVLCFINDYNIRIFTVEEYQPSLFKTFIYLNIWSIPRIQIVLERAGSFVVELVRAKSKIGPENI